MPSSSRNAGAADVPQRVCPVVAADFDLGRSATIRNCPR